MPISQTINALPAPPNPATDTSASFSSKAQAFTVAQAAMGPELNTFKDQANALETNVNAKETIATAAAAAALASQNAAAGSVVSATNQVSLATAQANASSASAVTAAQRLADMEALYDQFDDRYLGSKAADPTLDNDGNALANGAFYINTVNGALRAYTVAFGWVQGISSISGVSSINLLTGAVVLKTVNGVALDGAGDIPIPSPLSRLFYSAGA